MKKKQTAARIDNAAQQSVDETLREWYGHETEAEALTERGFIKSLPKAVIKREFDGGINRYLSRSVAATMKHYKDHEKSGRQLAFCDGGDGAEIIEDELETGIEAFSTETGMRLARDFMCGDFDAESLRAIGADALYNLMLRFYRLWQSERELNVCYSAQYHPQVITALDAQKFRGLPVRVCGKGIDIYEDVRKLEALEARAVADYWFAHCHNKPKKKKEAQEKIAELEKKIAEYKTRLRSLGEEVYETLQRAERRAAAAGTVAFAQFNATKDAALKLGAPDKKQKQRMDAAQWLIKERAEGRKASIVDAAKQYGNEIEAERAQGGYESVESLTTALHKHAEQLGITQFIEIGKRGRPRKR